MTVFTPSACMSQQILARSKLTRNNMIYKNSFLSTTTEKQCFDANVWKADMSNKLSKQQNGFTAFLFTTKIFWISVKKFWDIQAQRFVGGLFFQKQLSYVQQRNSHEIFHSSLKKLKHCQECLEKKGKILLEKSEKPTNQTSNYTSGIYKTSPFLKCRGKWT